MKRFQDSFAVLILVLTCAFGLLLPGCAGSNQPEPTKQPLLETQVLTEPTEDNPEAEQVLKRAVPILLYHHITEEPQSNAVSLARFEEQLRAITDAGYTAVSFQQLIRFVESGSSLPDKSIVITFDDGYESNLTLAAPILQKYGMQATVFVIGVSIGKDTYKDTGVAMIPHFALNDADSWQGVIQIESHGYDVHEVAGRDPDPIRLGVLQKENETGEAYAEFLASDCVAMSNLFLTAYGREPQIFAYPYGMFSDVGDRILLDQGIRATVTTRPHLNWLEQGNLDCLLRMGRFSISEEVTAEDMQYLLEFGAFPEPEVPVTEPAENPTGDTP